MVYTEERTNTDTKHDKKHLLHRELTQLRVAHKSRFGCRYSCGRSGTSTVSVRDTHAHYVLKTTA